MPDNTDSQYEWRETCSGRFERDLDEVELAYASLAKYYEGTGQSFFAITSCLETSLQLQLLSSTDVESIERRIDYAFQDAWYRLRKDHPTLASYVEYDLPTKRCKKVYESFEGDSDRIAKWLESSFNIIDSGQSGVDFANSNPPIQKHAKLFLVKPSAEASSSDILRRDIVFRSPHAIIDGIGTLMLLDNLMAHVAQAFRSHEAYPTFATRQEHLQKLSPPLRLAAAIPSEPSPAQLQLFAETRAAQKNIREDVELLSIPFNRDATLPSTSRRTAIHMSRDEAQRLTARCKAQGLSITHAFHAGVVLAIYERLERQATERKVRYVNYCLVNLRTQCLPPYNSASHAASVYHAGPGNSLVIDLIVPAKGPPTQKRPESCSFGPVATQIKDYYLGVKSDPNFVPMIPLFFKVLTPPYPEGPCSKVPPPNQKPSVSISSMGVIDKIIQADRSPFTVDAPWVTGDEYGTGVGVFLGSWRGEMTMSAVFNVAFHEEDKIAGFLGNVKRIVFAGLGIQ